MSVNNIGLKSYEDLFKDEKGRKTEEILPMDIKELKPYAEQPFKVLLDNSINNYNFSTLCNRFVAQFRAIVAIKHCSLSFTVGVKENCIFCVFPCT